MASKELAKSGTQSSGLTAKGIDTKWSRATWAKTEQKLNDFDLLVLKNLVCAARNKRDDDATFTVMGDFLYQAVRPGLNAGKIKLVDVNDSISSTPSIGAANNQNRNKKGGRKGGGGNKNKKGPSMKDQIRMQNSVGTLNSKIESSIQVFNDNDDNFQQPKLFLEKIVELRGIGFLCCAWFLLNKRRSLNWDQELKRLTYSIIVSLERFIKAASKLKGKSHLDSLKDDLVAPTLISDLTDKLKELKEKFQYSGEAVYLNAPQLLIFSDFDRALPVSTIKPYPHQARICKILEENVDNGCYIMYRAVTNAGKTTTIVSLAATVQNIRSNREASDPLSKLQVWQFIIYWNFLLLFKLILDVTICCQFMARPKFAVKKFVFFAIAFLNFERKVGWVNLFFKLGFFWKKIKIFVDTKLALFCCFCCILFLKHIKVLYFCFYMYFLI